MTPEERAENESRAERALRRGELAVALGLYESLARAFPTDTELARKLEEVRGSLQPFELASPKANLHERPGASDTPEQEGERLFAAGDYAGAAAAYRRALALKPDSELIKERLVELFQLARGGAQASAASPRQAADPEARLRALLDRVARRRRESGA